MTLLRYIALFLCISSLSINAEGRLHMLAKATRRINVGSAALAACTALWSAYQAYTCEQQQTPITEDWLKETFWSRPEATQEELNAIMQRNATLGTTACSWATCRNVATLIALGTGIIGTCAYLIEKATV